MVVGVKKILVLCTGNSCRSQIAEGFLRHFAESRAEVYSAGIEAHGVNPNAIRTMKAAGIDISSHTSDLVDNYKDLDPDLILTVCDNAKENCPYFPGKAKRIHHNFPDPAKAMGSEEEIMEKFAAVRDQIKEFCKELIQGEIGE